MTTQEIVIIILDVIILFLLFCCLMAIGSNRRNIVTLTSHYNGLVMNYNNLKARFELLEDESSKMCLELMKKEREKKIKT